MLMREERSRENGFLNNIRNDITIIFCEITDFQAEKFYLRFIDHFSFLKGEKRH